MRMEKTEISKMAVCKNIEVLILLHLDLEAA
jgi:hypothetical protein